MVLQNWTDADFSVLPVYKALIKARLKILVFRYLPVQSLELAIVTEYDMHLNSPKELSLMVNMFSSSATGKSPFLTY